MLHYARIPSAHCFLTAAALLMLEAFISMIVNPNWVAHAWTAAVLPDALLEVLGEKVEVIQTMESVKAVIGDVIRMKKNYSKEIRLVNVAQAQERRDA